VAEKSSSCRCSFVGIRNAANAIAEKISTLSETHGAHRMPRIDNTKKQKAFEYAPYWRCIDVPRRCSGLKYRTPSLLTSTVASGEAIAARP
jgi:hypothetical protein